MAVLKTAEHNLSHNVQSESLNIAREMAKQHQLGLVCRLDSDHPDPSLYNPKHLAYYHHYQYLPYRHEANELVLVTSVYSQALRQFVADLYPNHKIRFVIASTRDLQHWLTIRGATNHTRNAKFTLRRKHKHLSADRTIIKSQIFPLIWPLVALIFALVMKPGAATNLVIGACCLFYAATLVFKFIIYEQWYRIRKLTPADLAILDDDALPIYTLLVPVYDEPSLTLSRLVQSLKALDYPDDKKDILFICEADDTETIEALKAEHPPEYCRIIIVPPSQPRTKPKALNVAMAYAKGEYAVIYDAEDRPDPMQLKMAAARFADEADLACLQAPLNYYNRSENLLTKLFAIEYGTLFRMQLPALEKMGLPIPLGGTSNHMRVNVLKAVHGWDPFNVTEDADLGIRLTYLGHRISVLDSITMEEAPITLGAWMKQRSRWIKGYMQTWLVYMRDPQALKATLGNKAYYGFQFFVGAPALTFMMAPFFWSIFIASFLGMITLHLPIWLNAACVICLVVGIYSQWLYAKACLNIHRWRQMKTAAALYPVYWFLHVVASFIALHDLVIAPHQWRKTRHGVSKALQ